MKAGLEIALAGWLAAGSVLVAGPTNHLAGQLFEPAPAPGKDQALKIRVEAPNEIIGKRVTYRGIVVQWKKADKPWQLFNPLAPARYGQGEDNLTKDASTGKSKGFTLFSVRF